MAFHIMRTLDITLYVGLTHLQQYIAQLITQPEIRPLPPRLTDNDLLLRHPRHLRIDLVGRHISQPHGYAVCAIKAVERLMMQIKLLRNCQCLF